MSSRAEYNQAYETALKTVKEQLKFIHSNFVHLRKRDIGGTMEKAAKDFQRLLDQVERLTPNQMSYVNGIYERVFDNAGLGGAGNVHKGNRRRSLRYG